MKERCNPAAVILLPGIDFDEMAGFVVRPDQHAALKAYRDLLRARAD